MYQLGHVVRVKNYVGLANNISTKEGVAKNSYILILFRYALMVISVVDVARQTQSKSCKSKKKHKFRIIFSAQN